MALTYDGLRKLAESKVSELKYDALKRRINNQFDINDKTLSKLVIFCLEQKGTLSKKRRDQFQYEVPTDTFDALEQAYSEILFREEDLDNTP